MRSGNGCDLKGLRYWATSCFAVVLIVLLISGCGGRPSAPPPAPTSVEATTASAGGKVLLEAPAHAAFFSSVAYSLDGTTLAGGTGPTGRGEPEVLIWDARTGKLRQSIGRSAGTVDTLALSRDGTLLAIAAFREHRVRLWKLPSGVPAGELDAGKGQILEVAVSPDGALAAAVVEPGNRLLVWSTQTRERLPFELDLGGARKVAFAPDNGGIVAATGKVQWDRSSAGANGRMQTRTGTVVESALRLYDPATGRILRELLASPVAGGETLVFSADGSKLAAGGAVGATVWDVATGSVLRECRWAQIISPSGALGFSSDGMRLISVVDQTLQWCNLSTGSVQQVDSGIKRGSHHTIAIAPDGKHLAALEGDPSLVPVPDLSEFEDGAATGR